MNAKTIERLRHRFVEEGFDASIERKAYPDIKQSKVGGEFEARLIAISCSKALFLVKAKDLRKSDQYDQHKSIP